MNYTTQNNQIGDTKNISGFIKRFAKKILPVFFVALLLLPTLGTLTVPKTANAWTVASLVADAVGGATTAATAAMTESLNKFYGNMIELAAQLVISAVSRILWIAGTLLEFVVKFTVTEMATIMNGSPGVAGIGESINQAWTLFRDVSNLAFIFIILYLAFQLILGVGSGHWRSLGSLIVMAILINFSLFFTKVVIDASNILAVVFYAPIESSGSGGVTDLFMKQVNLQSIWNITKPEDIGALFGAVAGQGTKAAILMIGGSAFILVTSFVFFVISVLLMVRFLYLMLLMIMSPLAFACYVLPGLKGYFNKWWTTLIHQAFFAPAMFLLILMSFKILGGVNKAMPLIMPATPGVTGLGSFADVLAFNASASIGIVFNFALAIFFMIYSVILAQKIGGASAATSIKWAKGVGRSASSVIGRNTIGRAAVRLGKNESLNALAQSGGIGGAAATHLALRPMENLANSKFLGSKSIKDVTKASSDRADKENRDRIQLLRGNEFKNNFTDAIRPGATPVPGRTVRDLLDRASGKDLESFKIDQLTNQDVLTHMTKSQFEHLTDKSDKLTDIDKDRLRIARLDLLKTKTASPAAGIPPLLPEAAAEQKRQIERLVANMKPEEFRQLTIADFTPELISSLPAGKVKEIEDNNPNLNLARMNLLREVTATPPPPPPGVPPIIISPATAATRKRQAEKLMANMRPESFANLKHVSATDTEFTPELIDALSWNKLKDMADYIPEDVRAHIGQVIHNKVTAGGKHPAYQQMNKPENKDLWGL